MTSSARRPTIYDVAEAAGVAPSTVSRAFSRPGRINPETMQHILAVAERVGYQTRPRTETAASGHPAEIIGLLVSDVTDPRTGEVIRGAESAAAEAGFTLLLSNLPDVNHANREVLDRVVHTVDGIVLATGRASEVVVKGLADLCPVVGLDRAGHGVPSINIDHCQGAQLAAQHLASLGHQRLTYIAGPEHLPTEAMRWHALRDAADNLGLAVRRLGPFAPTFRGGSDAAPEVVRRPTSAVIAFNDEMAIGLMHRLTAAGARIPQDLSVLGFDDIPAAGLVTPALTTVAAPLRALGVAAVHHLLAIIKGARPRITAPTTMPVRLVVRESTVHRVMHSRVANPSERELSSRPTTVPASGLDRSNR